jgi:hypothetical protein
MTYKPLETDFIKNGFRFRQIWREGDVAVYHKLALEGMHHPTTFDCGFETFIVQKYDEREIAGVKVEAKEAFPSPELWGTKGWSNPTLWDAEKRFEILLGRRQEEKKVIPIVEEEKEEHERTRRPRGTVLAINLPGGEFTTKELASFNNLNYPEVFLWLKDTGLPEGKVKVVGERKIEGQRGPPSKTYTKA